MQGLTEEITSMSDMMQPDSNSDSLWRGDALYLSCVQSVEESQQKAFPKGALRRGQRRSLGEVKTPFGTIELSVHKDAFADLYIEHNCYFGQLLGHDGVVCGSCFFSTYRPVRGRRWLTNSTIYECMDAISDEALTWYDILSREDSWKLEFDLNYQGLMTAEEIWVDPELRGTQAWKVLYFSAMSAVFSHQRRVYDDFVFHAHPLIDADKIDQVPKSERLHDTRNLRRFYAVHLEASVIRIKGSPTEYMRAPVPEVLWQAWFSTIQQKLGKAKESRVV